MFSFVLSQCFAIYVMHLLISGVERLCHSKGNLRSCQMWRRFNLLGFIDQEEGPANIARIGGGYPKRQRIKGAINRLGSNPG